ncbi:flagellar protein export ATPase FliI [Anaerosalibacter massiliensis]|uniref:flagellar protein export ATPase FliI n=1 Tax=Anaerosalibacter massiliensis TaxID=1347392 RepID=UPI001C9C3B5A
MIYVEKTVDIKKYIEAVKDKRLVKYTGNITKVTGLTIESNGPMASIGELCYIYPHDKSKPIMAEVVGFREDKILLMPLGDMEGIASGSTVIANGKSLNVNVGDELIGRVINGLGEPIDGKGPISTLKSYPVSKSSPNPLERKKIDEPLSLGVKAIDGLLTCGKGQRIGIFAGSGVGKSTLMGMVSRNSTADVNVIGLIGERGREVREFIENDLKKEGLEKSVVVVVTSDQPALIRVKGAMVTTAIAEYFRDQGMNVMLLMDSLTRFAMAQREIGLAIGEPPVTRGFTPSVFALLPRLLERAGTSSKGTITGLYTVLVDGDDLNEPITDTVRGILDGHIVLSRKLANQNHYPAINILGSISRVMPNIVSEEHKNMSNSIKDILAVYEESEDLINIGAYKRGSNKKLDMAIDLIDDINEFLTQEVSRSYNFEETRNKLLEIDKKSRKFK